MTMHLVFVQLVFVGNVLAKLSVYDKVNVIEKSKMYPKNIKTIYQQEYPWKEGINDIGKNPS